MFDVDYPNEITLTARCEICRSRSWEADIGQQGKAPALGILHIYCTNPFYPESREQLTIEQWDDGFYVTYESFIRIDGFSHARATKVADEAQQQKPRRTQAEDFRVSPMLGFRGAGKPVGAVLRDRCRRKHRIDVKRDRLRKIVESAGVSDTVYLA